MLNEVPYSENIGVLICYVLATESNASLVSLEVNSVHDIGDPERWYIRYNAERFLKVFQSADDFLLLFGHDDLERWTLSVDCKGVSITINGTRKDFEIGVSYSKLESVDIVSLLEEVEKVACELAEFSRFYKED